MKWDILYLCRKGGRWIVYFQSNPNMLIDKSKAK